VSRPVTLPEADTIGAASPTVTVPMDCRNDQIYITDEGLFYRRWYRVHTWTDDCGRTFATPDDVRVEQPWRVTILRCAFCHTDYATVNVRAWRCAACERRRRTSKQRIRRASRRVLPIACLHCAAPLSARRVTRRYCSPRCRVAALRSRRI
jgi:hypothetical protein